jgi:hypothetical protein
MIGDIRMDKVKEDLKNKIIKEFNQKFFNGKIDILNIDANRYAVDFIRSPYLEDMDDSMAKDLLNSESSLDKLVELVLEFKN